MLSTDMQATVGQKRISVFHLVITGHFLAVFILFRFW